MQHDRLKVVDPEVTLQLHLEREELSLESSWEISRELVNSLQPHFETEQKRALKEKKLHDHFLTPVTC